MAPLIISPGTTFANTAYTDVQQLRVLGLTVDLTLNSILQYRIKYHLRHEVWFGLLLFNCTFSTNRLYCAAEV